MCENDRVSETFHYLSDLYILLKNKKKGDDEEKIERVYIVRADTRENSFNNKF